MLNESYASCLVMVKSTFAHQKVLTPQFQELVVSMLLNIFGRHYLWKGYPHFLLLLLIPLCIELLPDISVTRGNKWYTGGIVQLSVITGLFSMTATPCHFPSLNKVTANRTTNAECYFCSQKRSSGWIHPRLRKFPRNKCKPTATFSWVLFSLLYCS